MAQFFSTAALILTASVVLAPGDPVGISDDPAQTDLELRQVSLELARWEALRALAETEQPIVTAPGPWAADRQVLIERSAAGVRVHVTWKLETIEAGWWTGPLIGPVTGLRVESVTWRGRELGVTHTPAGQDVALEMTARSRGELKLVALVPADQLSGGVNGNFNVWLMPAVRGELRLGTTDAPVGRVPELVADGQARRLINDRFWASEAHLGLSFVEAEQATDTLQGPLAVAQAAVGLTFGDGEVRGRARVSWLVRRGQLDAVSINTAGLGRDLEVAGPNVHKWVRNGERVDIELKDAASGRVDVDLRWTQTVPGGAEVEFAAPRITPQQTYRTETFMQIARDGELEVLPKLSGWSAVARAELPDWASGHIQGTATASFRSDGADRGASFELLRFVPLSGPPVVVDVAAYEIATTDEGRSLVQARYDVRNERASHLRVQLPADSHLLGVRVNGETATPSREPGSTAASTEAWRIPIVRSLESVKGILSFPVEVIFISESDSWAKKESRELQLPTLDAPVAVSRVRVYLPPRYDNRVAVGDFHRVNDFSEGEGITYGLGVGAGAAELGRADELYREALSGWMANDFQRAQASLDELGLLGASSANIEGLQANLDLVQGRGEDKDDEPGNSAQSAVVSRRIKDQAKMRAADDKIALLEKTREAEQLEAQGQYGEAEQKLAEAQQLGDQLAMLEQSESKEQAVYNQRLSSSSARVASKKKRKVSREAEATKSAKAAPSVRTYDFEDDDVDGNLLVIDSEDGGELTPPPPPPEPASTPEEEEELPLLEPDDFDMSVVENDANAPSPVAKARGSRRSSLQELGGGKHKAPRPVESRDERAALVPASPAPDPNAALAGPVATASAVSVHVPAVGEAVLYQHMLLPEGTALTVHLEARRHKRSKRKSK
ncbi:hypothetical protein [Enhygromyxa salina]|uniref:Uncharacterized protein n=1 Tax=Enhygromyxa salina TaxID=215803 RepID=A0A2S9YWS3_9BACT|nr:hypothetical protein [Enhygromyxa salina]PRQ09523.1 hypothetical protein ENSA7_07650 [Enhygromyxa salina]